MSTHPEATQAEARTGSVHRSLSTSYWERDESAEVVDLTVGDLLRSAAAAAPDLTALVAGVPEPGDRRRWTFSELLEDSERVARALLERFEPGEKVAVWAPNIPEWILLEMGAGLAGIVLVTANPAYRPGELKYVLSQSGAAGIFLVDEFRGNPMAATLDEVWADLPQLREKVLFGEWDAFMASADLERELPEVTPDHPAQIQYTSGTTGFPKGATLRHRAIVNAGRFTMEKIGLAEGDVWLNPTPLFHTGGCVIVALGTLWSRATHIPVVAFDPALVLELIETEKVGFMGTVPTVLMALMEHPDREQRDLSSLRAVLAGGSKVSAALVRRIEQELGLRFGIAYGQTEASPAITQTSLYDTPEDKEQTIGQPLPQVEVRIASLEDGSTVPIGEVGEICCRGYNVMIGYNDDPENTAAAIDAEGWLHTGDLGSMDDRGYLRIEGRLKEMVIRGGENLYPQEIEQTLIEHPAVAEVAVYGIPDETWGEQLAAAVRLTPEGREVAENELRDFVRERLAPQKAPRYWQFVEDFPRTPLGKIQKFALRDAYVASTDTGGN